MNARVKQQGGWAGSFVVVGVALALLLIGGVYLLKSQQAGGDIADTGVETSIETARDNQAKKDESSKTGDGSTQAPAGSNSADTSENDKSENSPLPSTGKTDTSNSTDSANDDSSRPVAGEQEALPETGPADTALSLVAATALGYSTVAYVRSRRLTL